MEGSIQINARKKEADTDICFHYMHDNKVGKEFRISLPVGLSGDAVPMAGSVDEG